MLWLSYHFASTHQLFGSAVVSKVFHITAAVATAILFVVVTAHGVFRLGFSWLLNRQPSQLQRGFIVAILSFIAATITLAYFGLNLGAILATSALFSAIVGFSMQPMLINFINGFAVHRLIRVGDGVYGASWDGGALGGKPVEIISHNWRSVVARMPNGSTLIVPNKQLADNTLEILAFDRPARAEVFLEIPAEIAPHRVSKLVTGILDGFPEVDSAQPIAVLPQKHGGSNSHINYQVRFWVSRYAWRADVEGRVLRRAWYVCRRENFTPANDTPQIQESDATRAKLLDVVTAALLANHAHLHDSRESLAKSVIAAGETLFYDDGEPIVLPERLAGYFGVLIDGELSEITPPREGPDISASAQAIAWSGQTLTRTAALALLERALAARIGPYANAALAQASADGASLDTICTMAAQEIDDPDERNAFLKEAGALALPKWGAGYPVFFQRDTVHRLVPQPGLRAVNHATLLAMPDVIH